MTPRRSDAADRIVRESMRLFAERGYERTSVPEIQAAAGLAPGSGAMYKHFPSKEAVLREGVERFMQAGKEARKELSNLETPPLEEFPVLVRKALDLLAQERDELRVVWRELDQFPDLQARVRTESIQSAYRATAAWLDIHVKRGALRPHDTEAVAAVMLGGVMMFRVFEALWGDRTIPVSDERFLAAWCDIASRALAPDSSNQTG